MKVEEIVSTARDAMTVKKVFGESYQQDGLTIVPAATVSGGFGGGSGHDEKGQEGEGGGFGMSGRPVGAYVIEGRTVRWKPAVDVTRIAGVVGMVACVYLITRRRRRSA
jgi:uncharacterized spore protein YtfJ